MHSAKGYLIHDRELCRRSMSRILQWCIPPMEGRENGREGFLAGVLLAYPRTSILHQSSPHPSPGAPNDPHHLMFVVWGLDLLGPFKKAPGGLTHLLVAVYKFTKWIEAKPLAKISSRQAMDFIQDIIFHFGIPNSIITNNNTSSPKRGFWTSVMTTTSAWTGPPWSTHAQMGRSKALTI
jgi:hypothetical protein